MSINWNGPSFFNETIFSYVGIGITVIGGVLYLVDLRRNPSMESSREGEKDGMWDDMVDMPEKRPSKISSYTTPYQFKRPMANAAAPVMQMVPVNQPIAPVAPIAPMGPFVGGRGRRKKKRNEQRGKGRNRTVRGSRKRKGGRTNRHRI